jgi:PadR family transcriptional regulator PadR
MPLPMSAKTPNALLHGALDALILKTLTRGASHGYAIARFIEECTGEAFLIEDGSLYPALYRLERKGWVEAEWGTSELGRRAKLYRLTPAGREQLAAEMATWKTFAAGVSKVLFSS